jgi:hypothetical protein
MNGIVDLILTCILKVHRVDTDFELQSLNALQMIVELPHSVKIPRNNLNAVALTA